MVEAVVRIVHFADPLCWWSWGLEPVLRRLEEVYGDRLEVEYRMGGMAEDIHEWMHAYGVDETSTATWTRESMDITGNPVDPEFIRKTGVKSSYPTCRAFKAAERQDRRLAHRYFRRMMEAFQVRARPATEATLVDLAEDVGLDGAKLRSDMAQRAVATALDEDQRAMHDAKVNFLSLVVYVGDRMEKKSEVFTSGPFEEAIDRLSPGLPKRSPSDILEYLERHPDLVTAREIAEVFHIRDDEAREKMRTLERAGLLEREDHAEATFWSPRPLDVATLPLDVVRASHVIPTSHVQAATDLTPVITRAVQNLYSDVAQEPGKAYHFPIGREALRYLGYPDEDLAALPSEALESFAGVGYPFAAKAVQRGDTVLDIGSGSATDVLYASRQVGPKGHVVGLDITPAMIAKARRNIERAKAANARILEGNATKIPLPDGSVDAVTSNGVLNLVPDKPAAFREIFRVLKPGGRLQLADIVVQEDVGAVCGINPQLWADCIGGAAVEDEYLSTIRDAGFADVRVVRRLDYFSKSGSDATRRLTKSFGAESVVIAARKAL
jgi:ubiquinone/menaquinone biosynthesis C-methylase UbiE/predicted DsbA family dithiol-disulfide isomerase